MREFLAKSRDTTIGAISITQRPPARSLGAGLQAVCDQLGKWGRRYRLPTVLTIVLASRLAECQTLTETSNFGRALRQDTMRRIGLRLRPQAKRCHGLGISTLLDVLRTLDMRPRRLDENTSAGFQDSCHPR